MKHVKVVTDQKAVWSHLRQSLLLVCLLLCMFFFPVLQFIHAAGSVPVDYVEVKNIAIAEFVDDVKTQIKIKKQSNQVTATIKPIRIKVYIGNPEEAIKVGRNQYEIPYTVIMVNNHDFPAPNVHLSNNLNCTYHMFEGDKRPVTHWEIVEKPQVVNLSVQSINALLQNSDPKAHFETLASYSANYVNHPLVINPSYKGDENCSSDMVYANDYIDSQGIQHKKDETKDFSLADNSQLVNGKVTLPPHSFSTVTYRVRITLRENSSRSEERHSFRNTIHSVSAQDDSDLNSSGAAAAAAAASALIIDPQGVVYDSETRNGVAGAKVTFAFTNNSCPGAPALTSAQLVAVPGYTYIDEPGKNAVSMITDSTGKYGFSLGNTQNPSVSDFNCNYTITVDPPSTHILSKKVSVIPGFVCDSPLTKCNKDQRVFIVDSDQPTKEPVLTSSNATYFFQFHLGPQYPFDIFNNHIPLDSTASTPTGLLFLKKEVNKPVVELGDSVLYTLTMTNRSTSIFNSAVVTDRLPRGFSFVPGSARLGTQSAPGTQVLADPVGSPGASLQFNLNQTWERFDNDQSKSVLVLTYLAQVGVGAALDRLSVNTAQVSAGSLTSVPSIATVQVTGGVFSDDAYLIGKVYLDNCKADKMQNNETDNKEEEVGIPGVRLLMEDGTSVVTDIEGKYSLYGLSPITHVLKLDTSTLPTGSRLIVLNNRNSGKGDSRFVDLKKGELHKADFAVNRCDAPTVVQEVMSRRKALEEKPNSEGEAVVRSKFNSSYIDIPLSDVRSRPTSGVLTPAGMQGSANSSNGLNAAFQTIQRTDPATALAVQRLNESLAARPSVIPLEEVIKVLDNTTGFIDLKDGSTLSADVVNVRVKGLLDSILRLSVNGEIQSSNNVGKKSKIIDKKLEAWEYIGVDLKEGSNTLLLEVMDGFGNVRESKIITVIAPGKAGRVEIDAPQTATADFKTPVNVKIRLLDNNGVPVTTRTQLTLEASEGRWENKDLNPDEPGIQAFMEGGEAEFKLIPPGVPKDGIVRVNVGILQRETKISFLPEMRSLVGVGLIEGVLDLSKAGKVNVNAPSAGDTFERELRNLSVSGNSLKATGRAAFYFKGTIQGEYLLTTAYDSDKDTKQRLFRDIQPEKFYPIYGDSSLKGFDAQSTTRFYLRVDNQKSYLLYGDFTTAENNESRKLSQYSRSVTGVKAHYENGDFSATAFASRDHLTQGVMEIPANGTSGPYKLNKDANQSINENSEKIEILVRDRNQPNIILETIPLTRFSDYAVDPLAGEIFFKGPVASVDADLNPRTIRVTYEVQKGGKEFWMAGADARLKITDYLEIGGSYARDENPQKKSQIMGATAVVKLGDQTTLTGELARTQTSPDKTGLTGNNNIGYLDSYSPNLSGTGWAERLQLRHTGEDLKLDAQFTHSGKGFNNPTAGFGSGRTEATANGSYKITTSTNLKGQGIYTKNTATGGIRVGGTLVIDHAFDEFIKGEIGLRAAHESIVSAQPTSTGTTPTDLLSIRAKLTGKLPWIQGADVYGEAEQNVLNINQRILAVGVGYLLNEKTRLYGRYQFISSISNSSYGLNSTQQNNTAVIGVESAYMTDGRLFSEYRVRDAINGRESQAAMGLRQTWTIADGFKLGGSFEMTHAFAGVANVESKAITALAEYTGDPSYKLTGTAEARFASTGNSYSNTLALAYKIDDDWSALARHSLSIQGNRTDSSALWRTRQQIGVAWRQVTDNRWNALGRYEHRLEFQKGGINPYNNESHILSTHVNYQPHRDVITSGRYAIKWSKQTYNDVSSSFLGHLLYGRVTWDFLPDWDASVQAGMMADKFAVQYAGGLELGYQVKNDLWVSAGYNLRGFDGGGLQGTDYTSQGFYVRMRFKFDEGLFE